VEAIELQPFYHDVKNTIVQPKQVVIGTRYFWERWAPRLGPTLTVIIVRLRMHCYYNQATQERRDWCFPTQQTLAEEAGVSRWTVMRELKRPEARKFVRVQYRSRYDPARRQTVRISSLYHVAMDDPLVEEDRGKAAALLAAGQILAQAEEQHDSHCGLSEPGREVAERPVTGKTAKALRTTPEPSLVQAATGPINSKLPPKEKLEEASSATVDVVARELENEQVSPVAAKRLARQYPAELIREKMALVRELAEHHQNIRNKPGFLRKAIEEDYQAPLAATGTEGQAACPRLLEIRKPVDGPGFIPNSQIAIPVAGGTAANIDVWHIAKQVLASEMRPAAFEEWLQPSTLLHYELGTACIAVPEGRIKRYLEQRLRPAIEAALGAACGGPTRLQVVVEDVDRHV
jgi:AraC-like DNA-binding protein